MALTPAQREAVQHRYNAGEAPADIAKSLGIHHIAVYGFTRQMDMRSGKLQHPTKGKKVPRKPKLKIVDGQPETPPPPPLAAGGKPIKSVTETKSVKWVEAEPTEQTVDNSQGGSPLFPQRPEHEIYLIEVKRLVARPKAAGEGLCGAYPPDVTEADIIEEYGGGYYEIRALNARGQEIGRRSLKSSRQSRAMEAPEEAGLMPVAFPALDNNNAALQQQSEFQKTMFEMIRRDQEAARIAHEQSMERERERTRLETERERERNRAEAERQQQHFASLNQQNQLFMTQMMSIVGQKSSMKEMVETMVALKELTGGEEKEDDGLTGIAKAVITHGGWIGDMVKSAPAAAARPLPVPGPQAQQQPQARKPNPETNQKPQPGHRGPASYQKIAEELYKRMIADGVDPAAAELEVKRVASYIVDKVATANQPVPANGRTVPVATPQAETPQTAEGAQ